jgi:hypothetical protein
MRSERCAALAAASTLTARLSSSSITSAMAPVVDSGSSTRASALRTDPSNAGSALSVAMARSSASEPLALADGADGGDGAKVGSSRSLAVGAAPRSLGASRQSCVIGFAPSQRRPPLCRPLAALP